jgi:curved DNA binding protein
LIAKCDIGVNVLEICELGDRLLTEETSQVFKKEKELKKGIAFPTCASVNNCICHYSPVKGEGEYILKENDVVKLDLGAHVDGFIAVVAHTVVIGHNAEKPATGRVADAVLASYHAAQAAVRLVKPGSTNVAVTEAIQKLAEEFDCRPVSGMLSHQLKQFKIDGQKSIIQNPTDAQRKEHEKCNFALHEVYAVDVLVSTGEGKGREVDSKTTIYKKTEDIYQLKLKVSRVFYADVEKRFGVMPFHLRSFGEEAKSKLGLMECVKHRLLDPFNVLYEKDEDVVAQFKYTILLMPSGTHQITGLPVDLASFKSEHSVKDETLKELLATSIDIKAKKKKSKSKAKSEAVESTPAAAAQA